MKPTVLGVVVALVAGGCLAERPDDGSVSPAPTVEAPACEHAKSFRAETINATIETSKGRIDIILYGRESPITVCNFLRYVEEDFYDNTIWHRICSHVIQAGGYNPYAPPGQEQKRTHPPIKNEANHSRLRNVQGTIGMARSSAPDSATSHFFVNLRDNTYLDFDGSYRPGYAVFANVTGGWGVVQAIAQSTTVPDPPPDAGPLYQGCRGAPAPSQETVIRDVRVATNASARP